MSEPLEDDDPIGTRIAEIAAQRKPVPMLCGRCKEQAGRIAELEAERDELRAIVDAVLANHAAIDALERLAYSPLSQYNVAYDEQKELSGRVDELLTAYQKGT